MTNRMNILVLASAAVAFLMVPATRAQETPAPAQAQTPTVEPLQPTAAPPGPVGGVEQYRLEGNGLGRSNYVARLTLQEFYNSNPSYSRTSGGAQADSVSTITGGITLHALQRNSTFSLDYSSEGIIYNTQTQPNATVQTLNVAETLIARRWTFFFAENFSYLPSSAFLLGGLGITGGASAGLPGVGGQGGLNPYLQPQQSFGSASDSQINSSTAVQASYNLGKDSSLYGSGVVGYLHFLNSGPINSRNIYGRFGYDKGLTRRDTISFSYAPSRLDYSGGFQGFTSHQIQIGYRRFLTGRLHLSVLGGPNIIVFSTATGQTTVPGGTTEVNWSLQSILDYVTRRGSMSLQYSHGTSAGSGFVIGSLNDQVTASLGRQLSRAWSVVINGGFSHNRSFEQTTPGTTSSTPLIFNSWYGGLTLSRNLGRYSKLNFNYNASRQTGSTSTCVNGQTCGPVALTQVIGVTVNWSSRPLKIE